ncbi:uncharacterized protein LOC132264394 [Phlebotomus argentipes]|uniref:uncharacterized protein LOC132264394 n=1 Tax=Phlebotomus argentipes TaxID=94469 RepID=UPI00289378D3|nr:uncharacterized protein LOC132264394 [Phlebotomus argentipes]
MSESEKKGGFSPKMSDSYKKRSVDFTDFAYREAVNRLKYLLAESYTPSKMHYHRDDDTSFQSAERPVLTEISKYLPPSSALAYNTRRLDFPGGAKENFPLGLKPAYSTSSLQQSEIAQFADVNPPPPQELMNFIERQEHYIEQLEKESQFCREELANLLSKVKNVITENESLTDQAKVGLTRNFFSSLDSSESEENEHGDTKSLPMKYKNTSMGPNIVFESRISELEAQLAQAAIDFRRLNEENDCNKRKIAMGAGDGGSAEIYRKQIDNLQKDKASLEDSLRKFQVQIKELREQDSFSKAQRARDLTDQVVFERTQADIEIRRLKDELERQHERVREIQSEMARRISDERTNAERRYNYQVDQLGGDLTCQWEQASKLQLELERQKRLEVDQKRDLMQKVAQIEELRAEIKSKTAAWLSDVAQMNAEKQSLEQEITSVRMQLERAERQGKVESSRLNAEVNSLRQRLDRSDGDLLHARRENLRLCDQISALEKEITLGEIGREPRPKEMTKIITDMEAKHANTVSELEGMIHDQRQLMEKLTSECKSLTQKLEDTSLKHKEEISALQANVEYLTTRIMTKNSDFANIPNTDHVDIVNPTEEIFNEAQYVQDASDAQAGEYQVRDSSAADVVSPTGGSASPERSYTKQQEYAGVSVEPGRMGYSSPPRGDSKRPSERMEVEKSRNTPTLSRSGSRQSVLESRTEAAARSGASRDGSRARRDDPAAEGGNEERAGRVEPQQYDGAGELGQFGGTPAAMEYASGGDYQALGGEVAGDTFEPQYDAAAYGQAQYEQYDAQQYVSQPDYGVQYGDQQYHQQDYDPSQYVQYSGDGYDQQQPGVTFAEAPVVYGGGAATAGADVQQQQQQQQQVYAEPAKGAANVGNADARQQPAAGKLLPEQPAAPVASSAATRSPGGVSNGAKFAKRYRPALQHEDIVVQAHAEQQPAKAQDLQRVELLPAHSQRHKPNYQRAHGVQHHPGGSGDLLCHADAGEVEEGDGDHGAGDGEHELPIVANLDQCVNEVLECAACIVVEWRTHVDVVEGDQLTCNDVVPGMRDSAVVGDEVRHADDGETDDDKDNARPLAPLEHAIEEGHTEDTHEDDHGTPEHLEAGCVGEIEPNVHDRRGDHVTHGGHEENKRIEVPVALRELVCVFRAVAAPPEGRRKRFIDKNNSVTFHVVNRSQQDPLIADDSAPQHVLVQATPAKEKRKEEQTKYGIYFDDDYDYLQHLRPRSEVVWECLEDSRLQLPSSVFPSTVEEEEGMLNKAAPVFGPQPHLDPDIVAALDDDFDYENPANELEDDFMDKALAEGSEDDEEEWEDEEEEDEFEVEEDDEIEELEQFKKHKFGGVETKSRFTEYSISSSVMRRNEQLTLLDDRFEKFMANYDESEIGALDCEDLEEGDFNYTNDMLIQLATKGKLDKYETYDKAWDKERIRKMQEEVSDEEMVEIEVEDDEKPKIDCESILTVTSAQTHKPRLIESARRSKKIEIGSRGIPKNVLDGEKGLTVDKVNKFNSKNLREDSSAMSVCESVRSTLSVLSIRPKDESREEKRERKRLLKEYRAERRIERKANEQAFKEEKLRQDRQRANTVTKTLV